MPNLLLSELQAKLILGISIIVLLIIVLVSLIYFPVQRKFIKKNFKKHAYKKVAKIAKYEDFYLINDFVFQGNKAMECIDHILGGDKYFYFILDYYYDGDIAGKIEDKSLFFISRKGQKSYTENKILEVSDHIEAFSASTNLDRQLIIGLILVNDDCHVAVSSSSKQFYIVQRKKLYSLIKMIEKRDIGKLNSNQVERVINGIDKMNSKKRN